ncbi:MAG: LLM class flavin-dependent oxidoreductase [Candidatus Ranarchaeia archaeon]
MVDREPVKLDIMINPHTSPDRLILMSRLAEDAGFDSVWVGDPPMAWDSVLQVANIARHTRRVTVGWALTNPYTRSPVKTIYSVAQLDMIADGRLIFTWGAGDREGLKAIGYDWDRPLIHMREAIVIMRKLVAGETVDFQGETMSLHGVRIDFPVQRPYIPIFTGCRRKHMLRLTGELADGVLIDYPPIGRVAWAREQLSVGARRAKRKLTPETFCTGALLPFSVAEDSKTAKDRNRRLLPVTFVSITPEELKAVGLTEEEVSPIREIMTTHSTESLIKASKLITDEMVDQFTISGSPEECVETIDRYYKAGIDRITLDIPYDPKLYPEETIKLAKQKIIPYFKQK